MAKDKDKKNDKNDKDKKDKVDGTQEADTLLGDGGDSKLHGRGGDDLIIGGDGDEKIHGGKGDETLEGGAGDDKIHGGIGDETIKGGAGDDKIHGGNGAEIIHGGAGDDKIHGGNGNDTIEGGAGADEMHGGNGEDYFVYKLVSDSAAKKGEWDSKTGDTITSFQEGKDKIDFRQLQTEGGKSLHWSDDEAEEYGVWAEFTKGSTYLHADTDGDGKADLAIRLKGKVKLSADDVLLPEGGVTPHEEPEPEVEPVPDAEYFMLGGKNIPKADYDVDALWQKNLDGHQVEVTAYKDLAKGKEGKFGFEYQNGITRGIGVSGGGDEELQKGEGIEVDFDGLVNDLTIGVRALFVENQVSDKVETGSWKAYRDGKEVGKGSFDAVKGADDGRAEFTIKVEGGFDTLVFYSEETGADYYVEYIEGRYVGDVTPQEVFLPHAVDDSGTAVESGIAAGSDATGNVLTGAGADTHLGGDALNVSAVRTGAESGNGTAGSVGSTLAGAFGTLILNADGSYSYAVNNASAAVDALNGSETLTDSFTYTVKDTHGGTDQATLTITIRGANDAPVIDSHDGASRVALTMDENSTDVTTVHATDVDHGAVLTYSISGGADKDAFTVDAATGQLSFKNAPDADNPGDADGNNSYQVTVTVSDGEGATDSQTFTIGVNDLNEFAVTAPVDVDANDNLVDENAAVGSVVNITAFAEDLDGDAVSYSLADDAGGLFTIDADTGVVTTAAAIDFEAASSHTIVVRATSADGSTADATFTINVNDLNEFAVTAPVDVEGAVNAVDENVAEGTVVGITAQASDADGDVVTYSLADDAGGRFVIDADSGVVTTSGAAIDRESDESFTITVRATSADGSTADTDFAIAVNDVNEFAVTAPVDVNVTDNAVNENVGAGVVVGITAQTSDADATTNGVTYSLVDDAGGRFVIDENSGVVTTSGVALDAETASSLDIVVRATSADGSSADSGFTINVNNVNEHVVTVPVDVNGAVNGVDENAVAGTVIGITAQAEDADGDAVTYSLADDAGGRFVIDADSGVVTTSGAAIDRESDESFTITVRATSADGSTADTDFAIAVNDVNEFAVTAPVDANTTVNNVDENAEAGTLVRITARAEDADATTNGVTYSLVDDAGGRFVIDENSGVVRTSGAEIDFETTPSLDIVVRATSQDGSTADSTFTINVNDVSEFPVTAPVDVDGTANAVDENAAAGTVVGLTAQSDDGDGTGNGITYSLVDDAEGRFVIDADSGVVTTSGVAIDRETHAKLNITVRATSQDGTTADSDFAIAVNDVNEFAVTAPVDANSGANTVVENSTSIFAVGVRANAEDADATNNNVTYSLMDDAGGRFVIDEVNGVIRTTGIAFDYETTPSFDIVVRATSEDGSFADSTFTIEVEDMVENPVTEPVDVDEAVNAVDENAEAGTVVGITALADDIDGDTVTYSLWNDAGGRFVIDAETGVVTTSGEEIDREDDASFSITVRATSSDGTYENTNFTININDVNEYAVSAPVDAYNVANTMLENSTEIVEVGIRADAEDDDATTNGVTYALVDDAGGLFAIDADSGVVTTTGIAVDYEMNQSFDIVVRATSEDGSFADSTFTINVEDVIEHPVTAPVDVDATANVVDENSEEGTVVGITALATDIDDDVITYSLVNNGNNRFNIDAETGVVTTTSRNVNYEIDSQYTIVVRATSEDGSYADSEFTILVNDLNDVAPDFVSGTSERVDENIDVSTVVYDAEVTDPDGDAPTFSLSGDDAALFSIDAVTGEVRFLVSPDFETPLDADMDNRYRITVHANDGVQETTRNVNIIVEDVVEIIPNVIAPEFVSGSEATVQENTNASMVIYDAEVTDPDGDVTVFSLSGADAALFSIDTVTGEVRFLAAPDFELPLDLGNNNQYDIVVHAFDGVHDSTQDVAIMVTDLPEPTDPDPNDFDHAGGEYPQSGSGAFNGSGSSDTIAGSDEADTVNARGGNDYVYARGGSDSIFGSTGFDVIYGQAGDDTIDGGSNSDTIYGGSGNDYILSGTGNNVIYGGSGQDTISGDRGLDTIIGGYGADTIIDGSINPEHFVYLSTFDTGDTIIDFYGPNIFDFSALDANIATSEDDAFLFVAEQTTETIANSVTWHQANGNTYIRADVNGDSVADLNITITGLNMTGTINLTSDMFIL